MLGPARAIGRAHRYGVGALVGVPELDIVLLPPPPHPTIDRDTEANNSPQLSRRNWSFQRLILLEAKARPNTPAMATPPAGIQGFDEPKGRSGLSIVVAAAVVSINALETGAPPDGVMLAGENEQAARLGLTTGGTYRCCGGYIHCRVV